MLFCEKYVIEIKACFLRCACSANYEKSLRTWCEIYFRQGDVEINRNDAKMYPHGKQTDPKSDKYGQMYPTGALRPRRRLEAARRDTKGTPHRSFVLVWDGSLPAGLSQFVARGVGGLVWNPWQIWQALRDLVGRCDKVAPKFEVVIFKNRFVNCSRNLNFLISMCKSIV